MKRDKCCGTCGKLDRLTNEGGRCVRRWVNVHEQDWCDQYVDGRVMPEHKHCGYCKWGYEVCVPGENGAKTVYSECHKRAPVTNGFPRWDIEDCVSSCGEFEYDEMHDPERVAYVPVT